MKRCALAGFAQAFKMHIGATINLPSLTSLEKRKLAVPVVEETASKASTTRDPFEVIRRTLVMFRLCGVWLSAIVRCGSVCSGETMRI